MIEKVSAEKRLKILEDEIDYCGQRIGAHASRINEILSVIRDEELYLVQDETFIGYCERRWKKKKSQVYYLIEDFAVRKSLEIKGGMSTAVDKNTGSVPISELSQKTIRALVPVPEERRLEVLAEASRNGKPTEKSVKQAAEKLAVADVIERDRVGHEIPTPAMKTWERRDEVKDVLSQLSKLRDWAQKLQKTSDPFYAEVSLQELYTDLKNARSNLKLVIPYSICGTCQGQAPKTCKQCDGRGMISKFRYDHQVTEQQKSMMLKKANRDSTKAVSASSR